MPIKVKLGSTYRDAAPFVKRDGLYAAAVASVKAGGVYSVVSGGPASVGDLLVDGNPVLVDTFSIIFS